MFKKILFALFLLSSTQAVECEKEIEKLCQNQKANYGKCLKEQRHRLPIECRDKLTTLDNVAKDVGANCMEDIQRLCPVNLDDLEKSVETTMLKQSKCIQQMKSQFSKKCSSLMEGMSKAFGIKGGAGAKKIR